MCPSVGDGCRGGVLGGWCRIERRSFGVWRLAPPHLSAANPRIQQIQQIQRIHEFTNPIRREFSLLAMAVSVHQLSSCPVFFSRLLRSRPRSSPRASKQAIDARCPRLNPYPPPSLDCLGCLAALAGCWRLATGYWRLAAGYWLASPCWPGAFAEYYLLYRFVCLHTFG